MKYKDFRKIRGNTLQTGEKGKNKITEFSAGLNKTYSWFNENFKKALDESLSEFWGKSADTKLISISENKSFLDQREEFFVTQIRLNKELSVFIKLSKDLVKNLLENILGSNGRNFDIGKLTELEAKILTGFDNFLYKNFSHLIKQEDELEKINYNFNECNLIFILKGESAQIGKLVVKVPVAALAPEKVVPPEVPLFGIDDFLSNKVAVDLYAGYSRIKLSDLKNLEHGDIVLLENSKSSKMILKYDNKKIDVNVVPNPAIMIDYEDEENTTNSGGELNMNNDVYNMWDTIQVEIGAEFEKVKLSLGELKQISEGLIVDIGSVYDNKIELKVEEKIVASGELVIINDRYGVKINKVFTEEKTNANAQYQPEEYDDTNYDEEQDAEVDYNADDNEYDEQTEENPSQNAENDEDFDYSDFDVDEDDL